MKDPTIEQKAQRYDEAKSIMEKYLKSGNAGVIAENTIKKAFPELAESEDEKIRKWLICFFKEVCDNVSEKEKKGVLAWLEKQGEHSNFLSKIQVGDKVTRNKDGVLVNLSQLNRVAKKQGEQKPGKEEPEFKVGDWVVSPNGVYWHIDAINNNRYEVSSTDGACADWPLDTDLYHLWSIQDAKDGDVLSFNDGHGNDCIELIKSIIDKKIEFWFCLTNGNRYEVFDGVIPYTNLASREDATPATKEQRDTLFAKMKEAGYAFNFEEKELKKLGQPEVIKTSDQEEIAEIPFGAKDSELQEAIYNIPKGFHAEIDNDKVVIKKGEKPTAWSDEDERNMQNIDSVLFYDKTLPEDTCVKLRNFLKSLKDRVQPKVELTQVDKIILEAAIAFVEHNNHFNCWRGVDKHTVLSALHSLRPQSQWKPSDSQMASITCAVRKMKESAYYDSELVSLYQDLKKL